MTLAHTLQRSLFLARRGITNPADMRAAHAAQVARVERDSAAIKRFADDLAARAARELREIEKVALTREGACWVCAGDMDRRDVLAMDVERGVAVHVRCAAVKRCNCCGLEFDQVQWDALPIVGVQAFPGDVPLQLRNCTGCKSTLALELPDDAEVA